MSDGSHFSVQHGAVKKHGGTLQESVATFEKHSAAFTQAMEEFLGQIDGGAKGAFHQLQGQWTEAAKQVNTALQQLGIRVDQAGTDYEHGESEQQSHVQQAGAKFDWSGAHVQL